MKLKLLIVVGIRPEVIRLSCIIKKLDGIIRNSLLYEDYI